MTELEINRDRESVVRDRFNINFAGNEIFVEDDSLFFNTLLISEKDVEIFSKFFEEMNVLRLFNLSNREIGFKEADCTYEEQVFADKLVVETIKHLLNPKDLAEQIDNWSMIKIFSRLSVDKEYLTDVFMSLRTIAKSSSKVKEMTDDKIRFASRLFEESTKDLYNRRNS